MHIIKFKEGTMFGERENHFHAYYRAIRWRWFIQIWPPFSITVNDKAWTWQATCLKSWFVPVKSWCKNKKPWWLPSFLWGQERGNLGWEKTEEKAKKVSENFIKNSLWKM